MPDVRINRSFLTALLLCGTLDIAWAIGATLIEGGKVAGMLRGIAAGPFGKTVGAWDPALGAVAGLAVHFAIMAAMAAVFAALVRLPALARLPWWLLGLGYGAALYGMMYRVVLPLRWPTLHPLHDPAAIFWTLLPHWLCVGLPMAWVFRRSRT